MQMCASNFNFTVFYNIAAFPFVKNPEDNPTYSVHFSKQWHDTMLVSLHNFLATIFQVGKRISSLYMNVKLQAIIPKTKWDMEFSFFINFLVSKVTFDENNSVLDRIVEINSRYFDFSTVNIIVCNNFNFISCIFEFKSQYHNKILNSKYLFISKFKLIKYISEF